MTMMATSFWYQAAINAVGPVVSAIAGVLLAGLVVNYITRAAQDRRAESQLRRELISEIIETASTLYHHITSYARAKADAADAAESAPDTPAAGEEPGELRKKLLEQYPASRAKGEVIQARLKVYFDEPRVGVAWHAVTDCLRVLYVNATLGPGKRREQVHHSMGWEKKFHTGLSADVLADSYKVAEAYGCHLKATAEAVFVCPMRPHRISGGANRDIERALAQPGDPDFNFDYKEPTGQPNSSSP
jgi:hypothetical protein